MVYADWLIETGDPRGAFVSQHCQLENMSGLEGTYAPLLASTHRLEAAMAPSWLGEYVERTDIEGEYFSRVAVDSLLNPVFRHGLLHRIAGRPNHVASEWEWLRAREPVQGMEVLVGEALASEYRVGRPQTSSWRTLKVSPDGWFTANSVGDVLRWGFPELRELDLSGCSLGVDGARLLANQATDMPQSFDDWTAPPPLAERQLVSLIAKNSGLGDEGACILFDASTLGALEVLDLSQCRLEQATTLTALRNSAQLSNLRTLSLAGNRELAEKFEALSGWPTLLQLSSLALPQTATPTDLAALFPAASPTLRHIDLSSARELLKEPALVANIAQTLLSLDIGTTRLGDKNWSRLLAENSTSTVLELKANGCSLSDAAVEELTNSKLDRLVSLDLSSNKLTDKGLATLAQWPGMRHVTNLRLANNRKLGPPGYAALISSEHVDLATLDIGKSTNSEIIEPLRERFEAALVVRSS